MNAKNEGLKQKYIVMKSNGQPVEDCFVLKYRTNPFNAADPYALVALEAYANACKEEYPKLAEDLMKIVEDEVGKTPTN